MKLFASEYLTRLVENIFLRCGASDEEAKLVAHVLVDANLLGHDSHGAIRCAWYVDEIQKKRLIPQAELTIEQETSSMAIVNGHGNFGIVTGMKAVELAVSKARENHVSCVVAHNCHHTARFGAYVEWAARQEMLCLAACSWPKPGHYVAPWGGREGRLATNPFAYGVPTDEQPLVFDISTSAISDGEIRHHLHEGKSLPPDCLLDSNGRMTTDPQGFFDPQDPHGPRRGAILPFGGASGHKAFGINLLCEILSASLIGILPEDETFYGSRICFLAINPDAFAGFVGFKDAMHQLVSYLTNTPLAEGFDQIFMPGQRSRKTKQERLAHGIPLDEETWRQIKGVAQQFDVPL